MWGDVCLARIHVCLASTPTLAPLPMMIFSGDRNADLQIEQVEIRRGRKGTIGVPQSSFSPEQRRKPSVRDRSPDFTCQARLITVGWVGHFVSPMVPTFAV